MVSLLSSGPGSPAMAPLGSLGNTWCIQANEMIKYNQIFEDLQPLHGLLSGDKVKRVLMNSKLPVDILGRVWDLSDIDMDGFLDRDEFAVAMHLVYKALEKEPVPMTLPPDLIPPSKRKKGVVVGGMPVLPDLMGPATGPAGKDPFSGAVKFPTTTSAGGITWVITPEEKIRYDEMFIHADTDMDGFVNGMEIKDIFLQSGLPQTVLAHIWNLCDTSSMGKLNSEEFALAMYLIQQKVQGVDPPQTLSPDMVPPSMRAPNAALEGATGIVTDFNTSGMRELDVASKDIEDIKRAKINLEADRTQKDADIRIRNGEVQALQKELDTILMTVMQLETQKGEAQKRLDELDDKKTYLERQSQGIQEKCDEEMKSIDNLRSQIMSSEMTSRNQEDELRRMRDELNSLRQEEVELEQKVEGGKNQLDQLGRSLSETHGQISHSKTRVSRLQEMQNKINQCVNQYNTLISGDSTADQPDLSFLDAPEDDLPLPAVVTTQPTVTMVPAGSFKEDPFKSDPFANTNGTAAADPFKDDPFKGNDPFAGGSDDPFSKPAKKSNDAFDIFDKPAAKKATFSGSSDPFGALSTGNQTLSANDPFNPFGGFSVNDLKSPINPDDPFGTGSFSIQSSSKSPVSQDKAGKQKKAPPPPRPPAFKSSRGPSPALSKSADPFGAQDPFSSGNSTSKNTLGTGDFANFADFSPNKQAPTATSEAEQLDWATRDSRAEWDQERRLQQQEQADLELAIQLSKQ